MVIDPVTLGLLSNYAANVAADITRYGVGKLAKALRKADPAATDQAARLNLSIQALLTERGVDGIGAERVATYLLHQSNLSYLLLLCSIAGRQDDYAQPAFAEIRAHLALEAQVPDSDLDTAATVVFEILDKLSRAQLASVVTDSKNHRRGERPRLLSGQDVFADQQTRMRYFDEVGRPSLASIAAYTERYRNWAARAYSNVQLQHLGENQAEMPLETVHVPPLYEEYTVDGWTDDGFMDSARLLSRAQRIVLLGPAGSGKSTTVRHSAAQIAAQFHSGPVPIVIELRSYVGNESGHRGLFIEHVISRLTADLQESPPDHWLEYMLLTGNAVVFFDGFDEVLSVGRRTEIRDAIRSFSRLFPSISIVVTSRLTGYDLAPLDDAEFFHARICELDTPRIEAYARKWFALRTPGDIPSAHSRAHSFLQESHTYARDLRANPLMLSLLCSVYFLRGDIPRTLSDLYEKCAGMLYQQWNTMRGIDDHHAWDQNLRPALYHIADLVLSKDDYLSNGVPREALVSELKGFFLSEGASDPIEARSAAERTVDNWAGRAWIITAISSDEYQRPRFGFVHQSFLEYFAAIYMVRKADTPADLFASLRERLIYLNGWSVAQVAASTLDQWRDKGGERLATVILDNARKSPDGERYALLRFAVSLLKIVTVRVEIERRLVDEVIDFLGSTILLPAAGDVLESMHEISRDRSRAYRLLTQEDPDFVEEVITGDEEEDPSPDVLPELRLSTFESDAILQELVQMATEFPRLKSQLLSGISATLQSNHSAGNALASVFAYYSMKREMGEPEEEVIGLRRIAASLVEEAHWTVTAALAAAGLVDKATAAAHVPWHCFVLREPLILSYSFDFLAPLFFESDLANVLENSEQVLSLQAFGSALMRAENSPEGLRPVPLWLLTDSFAIREAGPSWEGQLNTSKWDEPTFVGFTAVAVLCADTWDSPQPLEDFLDPYVTPAVTAVIRHLIGLGRAKREELGDVGSHAADLAFRLLTVQPLAIDAD